MSLPLRRSRRSRAVSRGSGRGLSIDERHLRNDRVSDRNSPSRRFRCCFDIESRLDRIFKPINALIHNLREGRLSSQV